MLLCTHGSALRVPKGGERKPDLFLTSKLVYGKIYRQVQHGIDARQKVGSSIHCLGNKPNKRGQAV